MSTTTLHAFYDALPADILRQVGDGFDPDIHAMHRVLRDPDHPTRLPSTATLNRLISDAVPPESRVLDAGCGWGGTLLRLATARQATGLGLTLSSVQATKATEIAKRRGLADRVSFLAADYGTYVLPDGAFDAVVAIETLIHATDKLAIAKRLAHALSLGGRLMLVDDMPREGASGHENDLALFAEGWCTADTPTSDGWTAILSEAGLTVERIDDLTPLHVPRPLDALERLDRSIRNAMAAASDHDRLLRMGELGGIALERLYRASAMAYVMITARKP